LKGVSSGRDTHMLTIPEGFGKIAFEFTAVVGLPDQIAQRDAIAIQVLLDAGSENGAGRGAAVLGKGPEQQAAANIASGVLDDRQTQALGLLPVMGDIVEILSIGADLLKN